MLSDHKTLAETARQLAREILNHLRSFGIFKSIFKSPLVEEIKDFIHYRKKLCRDFYLSSKIIGVNKPKLKSSS